MSRPPDLQQAAGAGQSLLQRFDFPLIIGGLAWLGILLWLVIARYLAYNAGMLDLGVMAQSIWSGTQGEWLVHTAPELGQRSRLNVHVELFYFLLVPLYALWPDPRLLLIVQAGLFALGGIAVYRLAMRNLASRFAARCLVLIYWFYPVALTALLFDVHGDTLAMPLLLFALDALDRRAWRSYWLFAILALSCKFYVAVPLLLLGPLIWLIYHERRIALATSIIAGLYGALAFLVVRPLFAPDAPDGPQTTGGYLALYFSNVGELLATLDQRLLTALVVLGPALLLAARGWRWLLPALPLAAAALLSTGPGASYDYRYHHYALVVPFLILAGIDGILRMQGRALGQLSAAPDPQAVYRKWALPLSMTTIVVIFMTMALVDTPLNPSFWSAPPGRGLHHLAYGRTARDAMKDAFLASHVPPGVPAAASFYLAPHIANRPVLYLTRYAGDSEAELFSRHLAEVDVVVTDALFDHYVPLGNDDFVAGPAYEQPAIGLVMRQDDFALTATRDGIVLFERNADERALAQHIEPLETVSPAREAQFSFGAAPELLDYRIEYQEPRRLQVSFLWRKHAQIDETLVAVSWLSDTEQMRIVHLPSYALQPVENWSGGAVMRESFELEVPADLPPGNYVWRLGWYTTSHPEAAARPEQGLVAGSRLAELTVLRIPSQQSSSP